MGTRLVRDDLNSEPPTDEEVAAARRTVARHATSPADLARLLDMLGLGPERTGPAPLPMPTDDAPTVTYTDTDAVTWDAQEARRVGRNPEPGAPLVCPDCGRLLWHKSWPKEHRTDRVKLSGFGRCARDYTILKRRYPDLAPHTKAPR